MIIIITTIIKLIFNFILYIKKYNSIFNLFVYKKKYSIKVMMTRYKNNISHKTKKKGQIKKQKKLQSKTKTKTKSKNNNLKTIPRYMIKNNKLEKQILDITFNKAIETENVLLFFVNIFKLNKGKDKELDLLKKFRDKDFIIPKEYTNEELEEFHINLSNRMPDIIKRIEKKEKDTKKKDFLILFDNNDNLKLKRRQKNNKNKNNAKNGGGSGAYMKRLVEKGQEPITGDDVGKTLDEIGMFLQSLRYTPIGSGATGFQVLFDLLRGEDTSAKFYMKFNVLPQFFTPFPPSINFENISKNLPAIGDYLNLYTTHRRIENEAKVEAGDISPSELKPDYFDKMAEKAQMVRGKLIQIQMIKNPGMMMMM